MTVAFEPDARNGRAGQGVEKWLVPTGERPVRVFRCGSGYARGRRFVRVESSNESGTLVIVFFQHLDGSWCVYTSAPVQPSMGAYAVDA
ncbi:hypothetical protein SAMN05446935_8649 [Burkholderia sp. YR290]|nr:hypothetical protein SAMN05446934_7862 [Paraburkholderia hospita]SOE89241.1 hypothetical protein SAMN05446935_8649 [Burkholderia sp. YR290]